jgi:pyridoxal phosphate enzyme (YggS family)
MAQGSGQAAERPVPDIAANLRAVRERIAVAARAAGRDPGAVTLVAVSKTMPAHVVAAAVAAGVEVLGENRVQEAEDKIPEVRRLLGAAALAARRAPRWHLIGHLQTNKAKAAAGLFDLIESVDSIHLAQALNRRACEAGVRREVLLQVNVAGEASKGGFAPDELRRAADDLAGLEGLTCGGLMTIAPLCDDGEQLRGVFRGLRLLFEEVGGAFPGASWRHLSMGMSGDFELAIAEGATLVRIGRAIFGERG